MKESIEYFVDGYPTAMPSKALRQAVKTSLSLLDNLRKDLGLNKVRVHYTADIDGDGCACYCAGSQDWPVIVLNVSSFNTPDDIERGVESTLAHEFCHAYLETVGMDCFDYEHPEDEIEDLARRYCDGLIAGEDVAAELDRLADAAYSLRDSILEASIT